MSKNHRKSTPEGRVSCMDSMLSEHGFMSLWAVAQPLADTTSEIIGILHRELERRGMTEDEIRELVRNEENP